MDVVEDLAIVYEGTPHADDVERIADDLRTLLDDRDGVPATRPSVPGDTPWSGDDVWVIAYPDHFQDGERAPLAVMPDALDLLAPRANGVHVLPCYPWSSDDGYAVIDPLEIADDYGTWDDVATLARDRRVMLDAVVNHLSAASPWFRAFLADEPGFAHAFVTANPDDDLSAVVRPRSLPLLTEFDSVTGPRWVWTTFSADQVDVDIGDPTTLLRIIDVLVRYAEAGASAIRLDAIGFLWKEPGTTSIHLPQTHAAVRVMRSALDRHHPDLVLITETNVPHEENVSYLGGPDEREAQAVYQFSLPPLVLHTMQTGDATALAAWAATYLEGPAEADPAEGGSATPTTFLNFLASHDGIGLRPVEGLLDPDEVVAMADRVAAIGGVVNQRATPTGDRPYELCTTWFDAVALGDEERGIAHHLASHAIMLLLPGIAGIYAHSLVGSSNDHDGYERTGAGRSLNRARFTSLSDLLPEGSRAARVNAGMDELLALRSSRAAFHPDAPFAVAADVPGLFRFHRGGGPDRVLVEVNVARQEVDGVGMGAWRVVDDPAP